MNQNQNTLHSEKVLLDGKSFFLDLKEAKNGTSYLVITQTKPVEDEKYERIRMIIFEEEIQKFNQALQNTLEHFTPSEKTKSSSKPSDAYIAKLRETHPMAFQPWTKEEEELLIALFNENKSIPDISAAMKRQEGAITSRLKKLGLIQVTTAA